MENEIASKPTNEAGRNYFLTFIAKQDENLRTNEDNGWYASNWHRPENDLTLAAKSLNQAELLQVYTHKIRQNNGGGIHKSIQAHFALWLTAYHNYLPTLAKHHQKQAWNASQERFKCLFIYGFDYQTSFQNTVQYNPSFDECLQMQKAFNQFTVYTNIPNMLKKVDKFMPFAEDELVVNRTVAALEAVEFMRDSDFVMTYAGLYGALFTLLLSPYTQAKTCYNRFKATLAVAGNDAKHVQRVEEYMPRFEEVAKKYLNNL